MLKELDIYECELDVNESHNCKTFRELITSRFNNMFSKYDKKKVYSSINRVLTINIDYKSDISDEFHILNKDFLVQFHIKLYQMFRYEFDNSAIYERFFNRYLKILFENTYDKISRNILNYFVEYPFEDIFEAGLSRFINADWQFKIEFINILLKVESKCKKFDCVFRHDDTAINKTNITDMYALYDTIVNGASIMINFNGYDVFYRYNGDRTEAKRTIEFLALKAFIDYISYNYLKSVKVKSHDNYHINYIYSDIKSFYSKNISAVNDFIKNIEHLEYSENKNHIIDTDIYPNVNTQDGISLYEYILRDFADEQMCDKHSKKECQDEYLKNTSELTTNTFKNLYMLSNTCQSIHSALLKYSEILKSKNHSYDFVKHSEKVQKLMILYKETFERWYDYRKNISNKKESDKKKYYTKLLEVISNKHNKYTRFTNYLNNMLENESFRLVKYDECSDKWDDNPLFSDDAIKEINEILNHDIFEYNADCADNDNCDITNSIIREIFVNELKYITQYMIIHNEVVSEIYRFKICLDEHIGEYYNYEPYDNLEIYLNENSVGVRKLTTLMAFDRFLDNLQ